jgi:hypothetical protein
MLYSGYGTKARIKMSKINTKVTATARKTFSSKNAQAVQLEHEDKEHHAVMIWNLSVLVVPDEQFWFAQGIEINYGAQGATAEEAKENFQSGLLATIHQHLKVHGHINNILKFAPDEILQEAAQNRSSITNLGQVSFHEILDAKTQQKVPFTGIDYRVLAHAA